MAATSVKTPAAARLEPVRAPALVLACAVLMVLAATRPAVAAAIGVVGAAAGLTVAMARGMHVPAIVWPVVALPGAVVASLWPTAAVAIALVMGVTVLAVRAPVYGFAGALLLFGFEGSIKMRLTVEGAPSPLALGAALLDLALVVSLLGLLAEDRGRSLRLLWSRFGRAERIAAFATAAWVVLGVLQVPLGDSLSNGVEGLRLVHFYVVAIVGGVLLAARAGEDRTGGLLLWVIAIIAGYAAFRGIVGPTENEREFAESRALGTFFGDHARDTGSFTSHVALVSFLVPAGVFALVLAGMEARRRLLAGVTFVLTMIGVIASYVRTALIAIVAGALALALLLIGGRGVARPLKLAAVGLSVAVLAGGYGAMLLAAEVDPVAEARAESLADPFSDYSVKERLKTWERAFDTVVGEPLGTGVGTVGRATLRRGYNAAYTDNTFIKILQEQGFVGVLAFLVGVLGAVALCLRRVARDGPLARPLGAAAVLGVVAFLVLCLSGEFIEQPGKVLVWTLLGVSIWDAYRP